MHAPSTLTTSAGAERIHALDSLRAVAMLLGVALHAAISFTATPLAPMPFRDPAKHWSFDLLFLVIHGFRMHLFFFIAGFFARLLHERLGTAEFARQRFKRIGIPFLLGLPLIVLPTLFMIVVAATYLSDSVEISIQKPPGAIGFPPAHLWFLQFLLIYYLCVIVLVFLTRRQIALQSVIDRLFDGIMKTPMRYVAFVPLTVLWIWNGPIWGEPEFPGISFVPEFRALGHYGMFFAVGWWMHRRRMNLPRLAGWLPVGFAVACAALVVHGYFLARPPLKSEEHYVWMKTAGLSCAAIYAWAMTFSVTGLFLRWASQPVGWMRYMADASYWCYLAHLPIVFALQMMVVAWPIYGWLKFGFIIAATMGILMLLYEYRIRYTYVGTLLNGKRERPKRPEAQPALAQA